MGVGERSRRSNRSGNLHTAADGTDELLHMSSLSYRQVLLLGAHSGASLYNDAGYSEA